MGSESWKMGVRRVAIYPTRKFPTSHSHFPPMW